MVIICQIKILLNFIVHTCDLSNTRKCLNVTKTALTHIFILPLHILLLKVLITQFTMGKLYASVRKYSQRKSTSIPYTFNLIQWHWSAGFFLNQSTGYLGLDHLHWIDFSTFWIWCIIKDRSQSFEEHQEINIFTFGNTIKKIIQSSV